VLLSIVATATSVCQSEYGPGSVSPFSYTKETAYCTWFPGIQTLLLGKFDRPANCAGLPGYMGGCAGGAKFTFGSVSSLRHSDAGDRRVCGRLQLEGCSLRAS